MEDNERNSVSFSELLHYYLHKAWIIVLAAIVFAMGSFIVTKFIIKPKYTATASICVINKANENVILPSDMQLSGELINDYKALITSKKVTRKVAEDLNLGISPESIAGMINVTSPSKSRVLNINVTSIDPKLAKDVANTVWKEAAIQLKEIMEVDAVNIMDEAELPTSPSSPNVGLNTILGFLIGAVIAVVVLTFVFVFNDKITKEEDVKFYLGLNTLAEIPYVKELDTDHKKKHKHHSGEGR